MANSKVLNALYYEKKSPINQYFDQLCAPPILSLISNDDIMNLNKIAKSIKLTIDEKYELIDKIMNFRGFVKLHAGTNRVVYRFVEDQNFIMKIAIDRVGLRDNPDEFKNQFLLKPFVTKVFEVSPCGTVGLFERVDAIMSREEFISVADDVFNLITKFFVGRYILEDFGSHYFMNWGIRRNGLGVVLLDFPYVYELDGNKLFCNAPVFPGKKFPVCGGELDYDDGFNNLICTRCKRTYQAKDLKKSEGEKLIIVGGKKTMRVLLKIGGRVVYDNKNKISKTIDDENYNSSYSEISENDELKDDDITEEFSDESNEQEIFEKEDDINGNEESIENSNMTDELEEVLDRYDAYEEYSEYDDYDKYLSNRKRSGKKKNKKPNTDFSDF